MIGCLAQGTTSLSGDRKLRRMDARKWENEAWKQAGNAAKTFLEESGQVSEGCDKERSCLGETIGETRARFWLGTGSPLSRRWRERAVGRGWVARCTRRCTRRCTCALVVVAVVVCDSLNPPFVSLPPPHHQTWKQSLIVPIDVDVILIGFEGGGGYGHKQEPDTLASLLASGLNRHCPHSLESGEELGVCFHVSYQVMGGDSLGPEADALLGGVEAHLKANLKDAYEATPWMRPRGHGGALRVVV